MKTLFALFVLCAASASAFKLMTYNIHFGIPYEGDANLEWTASTIADIDPLLCGLNEVDIHTKRQDHDTPSFLSERTNLKYHVYHQTVPNGSGKYGIAMLSQLRPNAMIEFSYHYPNGTQPVCITEDAYCRGAIAIRVEVAPGKDVWYVVTHLGLDATERLNQVKQLATELFPALSQPYESVFLVGDFNFQPSEEPYKYLTEEMGWTDMWTVCGEGDGYTFDAKNPSRRIDYMFQKPATFKCIKAEIPDTLASDHRPLVYTFSDA